MSHWPRGYGEHNAPRGGYSEAPPAGVYQQQRYVGFDQFLNQMQQNAQYAGGTYSGEELHVYPPPQYDTPSDPGGSHATYALPPAQNVPNLRENQYLNRSNSANASSLVNDNTYFSSNLTPTATEFVPKSAQASLFTAIEKPTVTASTSAPKEIRGKKKIPGKPKDATNNLVAGNLLDNPVVNDVVNNSRKLPLNGGDSQNNSAPSSDREGARREKTKGNHKNKKKSPAKPTTEDVGRTFYNSSANKPSNSKDVKPRNQDVRYSDNSNRDDDRDTHLRSYGRDKYSKDTYGNDDNSRDAYNSRESYSRENGKDKPRENNSRDNHSKENSIRDNNYSRNTNSRDNYTRENTNKDNPRENIGDNYSRESTSRDNIARENTSRGNYTRDNYTRESTGRDNPRDNIGDNYGRESTSRDNNAKENTGRGNYNRENTGRDARDNYTRENTGRGNPRDNIGDNYNRENTGRDARETATRSNYTRENTSRDVNSRENTSRDNNAGDNIRDNYTRDVSSRNYVRANASKDNYRDGNRENSNRDDFYNSTRDNYRDSYSRNKLGSQRFQRLERDAADDEQFANNYLTYREDRQDSRRPAQSEKLQMVPASPLRRQTFKKPIVEKGENSDMTQRERLSEQLDKGVLECLVCCERVKQVDAVWSCGNCYHVLHLRCIRKWAMSSLLEGKWRCPACQNTSDEVPTDYLCFCGAMRAPEWLRGGSGAHTCGERCRRPRSCPHPCSLPCHPGPCPPCQASLNKKCGCGAETRAVVCSSKLEQVCGRTCGKKLTCGTHHCTQPCHEGPCVVCEETLSQVCNCLASKSRVVECSAETAGVTAWACGGGCGRVLACGAHVCRATCHPPPCAACQLRPEAVLTCPCGKMRLSEKEKRSSCTDPIPLCGNICAKPLACGPSNDRHFCKVECHDGPCPPCPDKTLVSCRCAHTSRDVTCVDLPDAVDNVFCTRKCNKKLSCGRHRCRELCCALEVHRCPQVCGRTLSCGLHRCDNLCHTGHCPACGRLGFRELTCECGESVLLPPVACGARPPPCSASCTRARACGHPPHHSCHPDECPPCVVLTTKRCYGGHEERKTIPCHQQEFSCGLPCGKPLPCGRHTCIKVCHKGECTTAKCVQQCAEKRPGCGHPCGAPCHVGEESPCPSVAPCRLMVRATCQCKRKTLEKMCADNARDFARMMSTLAASKIQDGSSVDMSDLTRPGANLKTLDCDDECRVEQRTKQMALVLQIRNPDTSSKLAPRYSEHVRQWAVRDPGFSQAVHDKLTELVQLSKKSKQKTRSHSFPSMNRQKRQFLHEMCEHFGCESVAYDAEPNRNVVATADREKSWLPAMSVLEVLGRESGKRRVPGPMLRPAAPSSTTGFNTSAANGSNKMPGGWATLTSSRGSAWGGRSAQPPAGPAPAPAAPVPRPRPRVDYFDNPPDH